MLGKLTRITYLMASFLLSRLTNLTGSISAYLGPKQKHNYTKGQTHSPKNKSSPVIAEIKFVQPESPRECQLSQTLVKSPIEAEELDVCSAIEKASVDEKISCETNDWIQKSALTEPIYTDSFVREELRLKQSSSFSVIDNNHADTLNFISRKYSNSLQNECHTKTEFRQHEVFNDWCRWPVCAIHRCQGQCPLGDDRCPDAHVGVELSGQIDENGLVRVCFESLGVGNKQCYRPKGCCRFFHPPEHIRCAIIRRRHSISNINGRRNRMERADPQTCKREYRKSNIELPRFHSVPNMLSSGNKLSENSLSNADRNSFEAVRLLCGLMDYGQLLRTCAAILVSDNDTNNINLMIQEKYINDNKSQSFQTREKLIEDAVVSLLNRKLAMYASIMQEGMEFETYTSQG